MHTTLHTVRVCCHLCRGISTLQGSSHHWCSSGCLFSLCELRSGWSGSPSLAVHTLSWFLTRCWKWNRTGSWFYRKRHRAGIYPALAFQWEFKVALDSETKQASSTCPSCHPLWRRPICELWIIFSVSGHPHRTPSASWSTVQTHAEFLAKPNRGPSM